MLDTYGSYLKPVLLPYGMISQQTRRTETAECVYFSLLHVHCEIMPYGNKIGFR